MPDFDDRYDDRPDYSDSPHRGGVILTLGIASLVVGFMFCPPLGLLLGVAAWVWGRRDLREMDAGRVDPSGRGLTQGGWVCGIVGTAISGLLTLLLVGYLVFIGVIIATMPAPRTPATAPAAPAEGKAAKTRSQPGAPPAPARAKDRAP